MITLPALFVLLLCTSGALAYHGEALTDGSLYKEIVSQEKHLKVGVRSPALLEKFYRAYGYRSIWTDGLSPKTEIIDLIESIRKADSHGLSLKDYNLRLLEDKLSDLVLNKWRGHPGPASLASEVEILATDSFLSYASDMLLGRARPESLYRPLEDNAISGEMMAMLYLTTKSSDITNSIEGLAPSSYEYIKLQSALKRYREIKRNGGWPYVKWPLKKGQRSRAVLSLRKRLIASGDLGPERPADARMFDSRLKSAVVGFQRRHGLPPTGFVGKMTLRELNTPVGQRIEMIKLNMERLRWMPVYTASDLIIVNLTDFSLRLLSNRKTEIEMKVIIGKEYASTPSFTTKVTAIVLNPSWRVPYEIGAEEMLPLFRNNPAILNQGGYTIHTDMQYKSKPVDPESIDWESLNESDFPYWLKRAPGNGNPLGKIKFIMPNENSIYLHDTPKGKLFKRSTRAFSHGCIRLEQPVELATKLLNDTSWDREKITKNIRSGKERAIVLKKPVMTQLVYMTAWVGDDERVQFRRDVYEYDDALASLMKTGKGRPLEALASSSSKRP